MGAVVPLQIGATVDDVVVGKFSSYPWQPILIILAAFIVQAITLMVSSYSAARLGALVTRDANQDTLDGTLDLDARTVEEAGSGDLLTRVTDDLSSAAKSVSEDLLGAIYVVLYFIISTISLAVVSPAMGLIMLPMIAGLALIMSKMLPLMAARNQTAQERVSDLNSVLTENIRGTSTIRELGVHTARETPSPVRTSASSLRSWAWCASVSCTSQWTLSTPGSLRFCVCSGAPPAWLSAGQAGVP